MSHDPSALEGLRIDRSAPPPSSGKGWLVIILVGLLLATALGAVLWKRQAKPITVHTATAQEFSPNKDRTLLNASGYVTARRQATISAKNTGKVVDVLIEEGMKVEENQILAHIDAVNIQTSLEEAQAQLESLHRVLAETQPTLANAQRDLDRYQQLADKDFASKSDLDRYATQVSLLKARIDRQQADIAVAERTVAIWKQQLDDTIIRAPFAGVVISKDAQPGEMVSPISAGGGFTRTGICTVVDMSSLEIDVDVNESYIHRVQAGQPVIATLDAYPDWEIPAKVIAIVPTADRQKATVRVRVGFEKLDPRILPDMSVKVAFQSAATDAAPVSRDILIPKSAVQEQDGKSFVWLLHNDHAERHSVTLGAPHGDEAAITTGLTAGEKIIVDSSAPLAEGAAVTEAKP
jgi:RND family efflux transporter MFP subunit